MIFIFSLKTFTSFPIRRRYIPPLLILTGNEVITSYFRVYVGILEPHAPECVVMEGVALTYILETPIDNDQVNGFVKVFCLIIHH